MYSTRILLAVFVAVLGVASAQAPVRDCTAALNEQLLLATDPAYAARRAAIESHVQQYVANNPQHEDGTIITIPVVVHVVWNTAAENVSDAQVNSQIAVLNEDFRRLNADAVNTLAQFQGVAADTEIQFCLATRDPNGQPTTGILRVQTSQTSFAATTASAVKYTAQGGSNAWPASSYLNMWVCDITSGILGFATFPGGSAANDGVVIDYAYFGRNGSAVPPFHLGRTATHEVGHWLNLIHIWGDGPCGVDDLVADTPDDDAANYGCPLSAAACTGTAMVQNYMDYTDDSCMNIFTQGQRVRMRAVFATGGPRAAILLSQGCGPVTPAPTVTACVPNTGSTAGGTSVTITGTGFTTTAATTVKFGGVNATGLNVTSATSLNCITPSAVASGGVLVEVINQNGTGSLTNGFVYTLPAGTPTIASLSPATGPTSGGTLIVATGTNYNAATRFRFGASTFALASITLSPTQAIVVSPAAAVSGAVSVTAINGALSSGLANGFTYTGGGQVAFWSDACEGTSANGWTMGTITGTQQFALGSLSGTSSYDPATAHGGTGVRGTVLTGNGLYGNSRNLWMRTPAINCAGKTGIRLRYWRHLTVEDGIYDQARIKVSNNGTTWTQVFVNASGSGTTNHIDTAWTLHDIDISAVANNQATVYVQYELQTDTSVTFGGWNIDDVSLTWNAPGATMGTANLALNSTGIGDLQIVVNAAGYAGAPCMNFMSLNTSMPVNTGSFFGLNPDANTYNIIGLPFGTEPFMVSLDATGSYSWGALGVSLGLPTGFALDFASVVIGGPGIGAKSPAVRRIF